MGLTRNIVPACFLLVLAQFTIPSYSQLGVSFNIKKPRQYEERVLKSEKSDQKKFNLPRRFIQNTVTHYNYFFNANNKLNEVIQRAKAVYNDDYSELLPFYNYSLDVTSLDKTQLDSVIYKSTTGIVLHDLRSDWIDNLYLLWGAAYYLRKDFDSASLTFQFINYAFAEKEKDGYYKFIGSHFDGNNALSIATREKTNLPKKIFSEPPSRNDAFIWQIRTFIAKDEFPEAASLIVTLKNDPAFPKRLLNDLEEVQAWWFYKQEIWDSAAVHLSNALDNATNKQERARWEYLAAQLYEKAGKYEESKKFYAKSIIHTTDPIMDIYARLNSIRINKKEGQDLIDENIAELMKMAKRDKYQDYRDVIYFMAAQMEMERNNMEGAQQLLLKGLQYTKGNDALRNKVLLRLAEMAYAQKKYRRAADFYDSLNVIDKSLGDPDKIQERKELLHSLAIKIDIIERQDSLQRIASMSEEDRKEFVNKLLKQLRKQQGLKGDENASSSGKITDLPQQLFSNNQSKGEWYFYNTSMRTKGQVEFRSRWGKRPNVDNWRRINAVTPQATDNSGNVNTLITGNTNIEPTDLTFDALYQNIPLTEEQLLASGDAIQNAMYELGKIYVENIEDCDAVIETYEKFKNRFPHSEKLDEVLFALYYCYTKTGETSKANDTKHLLQQDFPTSKLTTIAITGKNPEDKNANPEATKAYENIYDLFIEGRFDEALEIKKIADQQYGKIYWTPQLLYIEAVYYVKQRQDSLANISLANIISQYPDNPLSVKANNLKDVLARRKEIEDELTKLQIERPAEDTLISQVQTEIVTQPQTIIDTTAKSIVINVPPKDSTIKKPEQPRPASAFSYTPQARHYVMIILNKVDIVFGNEAKNAFSRYNREKYNNQPLVITVIDLDPDNKLLLIGSFSNDEAANDYVQKTKPIAGMEIVPWLKGEKYNFSIITDTNLEILKNNPDLVKYKKFIEQYYQGKF